MSTLEIVNLSKDRRSWSEALNRFPEAGLAHLHEWGETIESAYGMECAYLAAVGGSRILGLLPLGIVKSRLFPKAIVSMPYLNDGGILARNAEAESVLWEYGKAMASRECASYLELRHTRSMALGGDVSLDKIGMRLDLSGGKDHVWMKKLHSNVRNKIRKSEKLGVEIREGHEWLPEFHRMHRIRMQELGSPAHSLRFFAEAFDRMKDRMRLYVAIRQGEVIGGKVVAIFNDTVYFLWAASPEKQLKYAAVSLLNWRAIEDAMSIGITCCDFGRSTPWSSHYDYKAKWGAIPIQLYWHHFAPDGHHEGLNGTGQKSRKYELVSQVWKRLPLAVVEWLGPKLRPGLPQ